ncbi:hypothetical protein SAMN05444412_10791 [Rhodonellum ikkaensis]|uniref:Uncharacterized protein n=1 Tax=Rhodonellum ikkaensis TaxID=336829 RepID=A0A1H3R073_9BACT|nr:hypothetical protein SAMN05444412_10791 [Rhodonellum ikkaensis]
MVISCLRQNDVGSSESTFVSKNKNSPTNTFYFITNEKVSPECGQLCSLFTALSFTNPESNEFEAFLIGTDLVKSQLGI